MMVFDERFGEVPSTLLAAIKRYKVTPAEFYAMEYACMSHADIEAHIKSHVVDGHYYSPLFL